MFFGFSLHFFFEFRIQFKTVRFYCSTGLVRHQVKCKGRAKIYKTGFRAKKAKTSQLYYCTSKVYFLILEPREHFPRARYYSITDKDQDLSMFTAELQVDLGGSLYL